MGNSRVSDDVESVLHHRLADSIEVEFRRFLSHRLQPQGVDGLKRCEFKLLRAERKEDLKLWIGNQPGVEQLSTRNSEVGQQRLVRGVIP